MSNNKWNFLEPFGVLMNLINSNLRVADALTFMYDKNINLYKHSVRTAILSAIFLKLIEDDYPLEEGVTIDSVILGALLHDIGDVSITSYPQSSYYNDMTLIEQKNFLLHIANGCLHAAAIINDPIALKIIESHHEFLDGTGQPKHLTAETIPLYVRLVTLVDYIDLILNKYDMKKSSATGSISEHNLIDYLGKEISSDVWHKKFDFTMLEIAIEQLQFIAFSIQPYIDELCSVFVKSTKHLDNSVFSKNDKDNLNQGSEAIYTPNSAKFSFNFFEPICDILNVLSSELWVGEQLNILRARDEYLSGRSVYEHSFYVAMYTSMLLKYTDGLLDSCDANLNSIIIGALLHDIGYSTTVIVTSGQKVTDMNSFERTQFYAHIENGVNLVKQLTNDDVIIHIVEMHHEFLNGSGQPNGLSGNSIPTYVRVVQLANAFDNLLSKINYDTTDANDMTDYLSEYLNDVLSEDKYDLEIARSFILSFGNFLSLFQPVIEQLLNIFSELADSIK